MRITEHSNQRLTQLEEINKQYRGIDATADLTSTTFFKSFEATAPLTLAAGAGSAAASSVTSRLGVGSGARSGLGENSTWTLRLLFGGISPTLGMKAKSLPGGT
jgi:hypothetical protein